MPLTSGQINTFVVTRDEIIQDVMEDLELISDGQTPQPGDIVKVTRKINFIIKAWAAKGRLLWCLNTIIIPMIAGKVSYTIGPIGADIISYRPLRAFEGTFIRNTTNGVNNDTSLQLLSRLEYENTSAKGSLGVPNSFYYNPTMTETPNLPYDPQSGLGIAHFYVGPFDSTRTIHLQVQRPIQDVTSAINGFDVPVEWYLALTKSIQKECCGAFSIPLARRQIISAEAKEALDEISDWGVTEEAPFTLQPDYQMMMGRRL